MSAAYVLSIAELRGSPADAAASLAAELGTTPYELALSLSAGLPAVVLSTGDGERAAVVGARIRSHGHRVQVCDRRTVVKSGRMTLLRDLRFDPDEIVASVGSDERLPYADIAALLRAQHRATTETVTEVKERKLRPGMALATGGLVMSKTTTRKVTAVSEDREQVLYIYRRSGEVPWILKERAARYGGLGAEMSRTSRDSFASVIGKLRALAPQAAYDERLMGARSIRGVADGVDAVDLLAHLLAADLGALALAEVSVGSGLVGRS